MEYFTDLYGDVVLNMAMLNAAASTYYDLHLSAYVSAAVNWWDCKVWGECMKTWWSL
jgi:hypothetical protein